jgi:hypothetical protein
LAVRSAITHRVRIRISFGSAANAKQIFAEENLRARGARIGLVSAPVVTQNLHGLSDFFTASDEAMQMRFLIPPLCYWLV